MLSLGWAHAQSFSNVATVSTQPCSTSSYVKVTDCHDSDLPEAPSLQRNMLSGSDQDANVVAWPDGTPGAGKTWVMPHHRSSRDGRLLMLGDGGRPALSVFRPETVDYDFNVRGDGTSYAERAFSNIRPVAPATLFHLTDSGFDFSNDTPAIYHHTICEDYPTDTNPRSCKATVSDGGNGSTLLDGDCYDFSAIGAAAQHNGGLYWEMMSNRYTAFIPDAKQPVAGSDQFGKILLYPRIKSDVLPLYSDYASTNAHWDPAQQTYNWSANFARQRAQQLCLPANSPGRPKWCQLFDEIETSAVHGFVFDRDGDSTIDNGEFWDGNPAPFRTLFEPAVTADGRLLVLNGGLGLWYGYSEQACSVAGWKFLRPVTAMPFDSRVNNRYPIAKAQKVGNVILPFRDSNGHPMNRDGNSGPWPAFMGAYPWIDREGRNLFWSAVNETRDAYHGKNVTEPCPPDMPAYQCTYHAELDGELMSVDRRPGKSVSVVGAWTRGKTVQLDYAVNLSDFGNAEPNNTFNDNYMPKFELPLFQGAPTLFQAKASQEILSFENLFNAYDALSPSMPFDVVWTLSTDIEQNSEVVFDEYMNDNAFIVAHMNSPLTSFNCGRDDCHLFPDDGFVPSKPHKSDRFDGEGSADFSYRRSPRVQNASTLEGRLMCPPGTSNLAPNCRLTWWAQRPDTTYVYSKTTGLLTVTDFTWDGPWFSWLDCPFGTTKISATTQGSGWATVRTVTCDVPLPDGYTSQDVKYQNNALTVHSLNGPWLKPPKWLTAYGGARVQPVTLGGVIGKGIWLDGKNDHVEARFPSPGIDDWFASVWLDNRATDSIPRTVFTFADGSRVAISSTDITVRDRLLGRTETVPIGHLGLQQGTYFHFGLKVTTQVGRRVLEFYINGTPLHEGLSFAPNSNGRSFTLAKRLDQWGSAFWLGDPGRQQSAMAPFKGWADELRVYALTPREQGNHTYFEETICNLALGSRVRISNRDGTHVSPKVRALHAQAVSHGLLNRARSTAVCEQLVLESHDKPGDLPDQPEHICADKAHRNAHPYLGHRCLRKSAHGIEDLPIIADVARPDFSELGFCLSCHSNSNRLESLKVGALTAGVTPRFNDPRRQPMDVPHTLTGCTPVTAPFAPSPNCDAGSVLLDVIFDAQEKILPH